MNARPPSANIRVPSIPPLRTRATSVVPPPTSTNRAPAWRMWSLPSTRATAYGSATISRSSRSSCEATLWSAPRWTRGANALKMPILTCRPWKPTGIGQGVAVDRGAGHGGVDEPDVDVRQARLPGDRPLRLLERLALDDVDQLLELALGDRLVGLLALLGVGGGEALDQLAGDPDDDLGRPEAGHLLGLLERDRAVVDDRRDVGDGARLHVRQPLALASDAADGAVAGAVDVEDERLGELGADVERGTGGEGLLAVALPDPPPEGHQAPVSSRDRIAARAASSPSRRVPRPWAIAGRPPPRPSIAGIAALTRSPAEMPRATRSSETVTNSCGSGASSASATTPEPSAAADVARRALEHVHRVVRDGRGDQADARGDLARPGRPARRASGSPTRRHRP